MSEATKAKALAKLEKMGHIRSRVTRIYIIGKLKDAEPFFRRLK